MAGATVEEYIPLAARVNHDETMDVLIEGTVVPGGSGLSMKSVLELLARYAGENGKVLLTTTHPNGRVTRDLVAETGEVTPFYREQTASSEAEDEATDPAHEALLQALKQGGQRRVSLPDIESAPPAPVASETRRVKLGEGAIPKFDVESDILKAMAAKKPVRSSAKTMVLAILVTLSLLVVVAIAGWFLLAGPGGPFL